jgi:NAD(P)-dependent dehydrogenase (short-subunit alcohol dehydrogenase family)
MSAPTPDAATEILSQFRLDGAVALVTGASSGIGARAGRVFDSLGATVALAARRLDRLESVAATLRGAAVYQTDVSEPGASEELAASVVRDLGRIDVVFAAAGITTPVPAFTETSARFREVVAVNLFAPYELARAAALDMRSRGEGGSVVFVSSFVAARSLPTGPAAGYVASKAGLLGLTRELAMQWSRYGIRVNSLTPGFYPSDMTPVPPSPEMRDFVRAEIPMRRIASEPELDAAIAFLSSPASSYMTGHSLVVDGGASL